MSYWLVPMASRSGFHKPGVDSRTNTSLTRGSTLRSEQGGRSGLLIEGIWKVHLKSVCIPFTPESSASVVGLSSSAIRLDLDPTAPASTAHAVPSLCSVDAGLSLAPLAPAHVLARRAQSAHADDGERLAFPLDLLPARSLKSLPRHCSLRDDQLAHLYLNRRSMTPETPRRAI